jgi:Na+-transporting NADH:ubiquinone oxidoreductase subunit NqrA
MSYHGKLQVLKNGTADKEIQLWAYHQLEKELTLTDGEIEECFEESCTDFKLLENGKTKGVVNIIDVGRAILRKANEK